METSNALELEGLFRIGASSGDLQLMKQLIEEGVPLRTVLQGMESTDPHCVACLIKDYLRDLPGIPPLYVDYSFFPSLPLIVTLAFRACIDEQSA